MLAHFHSVPLDFEPVRHSLRPILEAQRAPPGLEVAGAIPHSRGNRSRGSERSEPVSRAVRSASVGAVGEKEVPRDG